MKEFNNGRIKQFAWHLNGLNNKLKSKVDVRVVGFGDSVVLSDGIALVGNIYKGKDYAEILHNIVYKICDISDGDDIFVVIEHGVESEDEAFLNVGIAKKKSYGFEIYKSNDEVVKCTIK